MTVEQVVSDERRSLCRDSSDITHLSTMTLKLGGTRWVTAVTLLSAVGILVLMFSSFSALRGRCTVEECKRRIEEEDHMNFWPEDNRAAPVQGREKVDQRVCECKCNISGGERDHRGGGGGGSADRSRRDQLVPSPSAVVRSSHKASTSSSSSAAAAAASSSSSLSSIGRREGQPQLKVYVYKLPRYANMPLTLEMYNRRFSNRLYMHAAEYWIITDLTKRSEPSPESRAVMVENPEEADVVLVPFLGSQSFEHCRIDALSMHRFVCRNVRDEDRQEQFYRWLVEQPAWQRSGGYDHVFVVSHPLALGAVRRRLRQGMFLSVDFGYYCADEVSMGKDVIIPYQHVVPTMTKDEIKQALESTTSRRRMYPGSSFVSNASSIANGNGVGGPTPNAMSEPPSLSISPALLYFCGEVFRHNAGIVRWRMWKVLKDEADVVWVTTQFNDYFTPKLALEISGMRMRASEFCLSPAGDSPTSARLFDALQSLCIPVVVSDHMEFPFERWLNWSEIAVIVKEKDAVEPGYLIGLLRGISEEQRLAMRRRIAELLPHFVYAYSWLEPQGAVNMIWEEVSQKLPIIQLQKRRHMRGLDSVQTLDLKENLAAPGCRYHDDPDAEAELIKAKEEYQQMKQQQQQQQQQQQS